MWIIPKTSEFSAYAAECLGSNEELNDPALILEQSLTWRGKHSCASTWRIRWKRVWWMRRLFGQMLQPSTANRFVIKYTSSLEVIPAREKAPQGYGGCKMIQDSFGRILNGLSARLTLFPVSSKTSMDTSQELSHTFLEAYEILVTRLRREYIQRLRSELHIRGNESSSLHVPILENFGDVWPTPTTDPGAYRTSPNGKGRLQLTKTVALWPTPTLPDRGVCETEMNRRSPILEARVLMWATPLHANGQLGPECHKKSGKNQELLNPAWVAQLMGTTLGLTFFGCMEMESSNKPLKKRGLNSQEK